MVYSKQICINKGIYKKLYYLQDSLKSLLLARQYLFAGNSIWDEGETALPSDQTLLQWQTDYIYVAAIGFLRSIYGRTSSIRYCFGLDFDYPSRFVCQSLPRLPTRQSSGTL